MEKRILLSSPHMSGNEKKYIKDAFDTNWIAPLGPNVEAFEKELADYDHVKGASVTSSGTAAIHLALAVLGVGKGDNVFCSSLTFIASANPVLYLGGNITFIDSEPDSWNMSPQALEHALSDAKKNNKLPKAIVVVNLYGQSAKYDEIMPIANAYGVPVVEDAAESFGSEYHGKKSGTFGAIGVHSFNGNKIITTSGGGTLVSNNQSYMDKAFFLATQAKEKAPYYQHEVVGYNYRMSNIIAGVGRAQLQVLDQRVDRRREINAIYQQELGYIAGLNFAHDLPDSKANNWLTTATLDYTAFKMDPWDFMDKMNAANIETRSLWKPMNMQPLFKNSKFYQHNSEHDIGAELFSKGICLPSGSNMTDAELTYVIDNIKRILG